jgi:GNAT superfamily N-acetyltransferase
MSRLANYARNLVSARAHARVGRPPLSSDRAATAPTLQFREYEAADRAAVIDLLARGRPAHFRPTKEAIFDWQFHGNPDSDGSPPFLLGTVDGEIVAMNGFMPAKVRYRGAPARGSWSCDTYVSSSFRGQGFGKELIRRVSSWAPVMLGYGISDMSDPIFDKQGWELQPTKLLFFYVSEPGLKGVFKDLATQAAARIRGLQGRAPRVEIARQDEDFGAELDELWARCAGGYSNAIERSSAYLNWKYRQHPVKKYAWYAAREGGRLRAILVGRHSRKASVLVDYCGPADALDLMSGLVVEATADMAERGTMRVQCETTHEPLLAALSRSGFIGSRYRPRFRVRTDQPADPPAEGWLLMPGDSDGDMM